MFDRWIGVEGRISISSSFRQMNLQFVEVRYFDYSLAL